MCAEIAPKWAWVRHAAADRAATSRLRFTIMAMKRNYAARSDSDRDIKRANSWCLKLTSVLVVVHDAFNGLRSLHGREGSGEGEREVVLGYPKDSIHVADGDNDEFYLSPSIL